MAKYQATLMHGERGGEGSYTFEAKDGLIQKSPMKTLKAFIAHLEATAGLGHIDWIASAALRNKEKGVVTAMGSFIFHGDDEQPFICMITEAKD